MLAAYVTAHGPADAIVWGERPDPRPGPGEVLVRTRAVAVDHVDTFVRSGVFATSVVWPLVVGRDLVGEVVQADAESTYETGELVWSSSLGYDGRPGAAAELVAVPVDRCYRLPPAVGTIDAVAVVHGATTALLALRRAGLAAGEHVFVHGAGGGVGSVVVQAALDAGARVTATARDDHALDWLHGLAESVDAVDTRVEAPAPANVDVHWDCTGRLPLDAAIDTLAPAGRVVVTARRESDAVPAGSLYLHDQSILGFVASGASGADLAWAAGQTNRLLVAGLRVPVVHPMPMAEAAHAHQMLEAGQAHGKIVLIPPEAAG
ncbi:MAG: zinc-binding dehydrogenase [Nocardioidaceae bacterium]